MTKILTKTYADLRLHVSYALFGACLFAALVYGVNIYRVVAQTVMIQQTEKQEALLGSAVQELDSRYLDISGELTPDRIRSFGLHESQVSEYVSRSMPLGRIALSLHEL